MTAPDVVALGLVFVKGLLFLVGLVFLASGVDDLFVDVYHAIRAIYRRFFVLPRHRPLSLKQLQACPEQPIAIMIPAWDESAVIRRMLESTLQAIDYAHHHVFVGTYPNDLATQREVERVRENHGNVHRVVCPKDGPTNKADCLNWIYQGIRVFEKESGVRFEIFVMNDSEDIVHPLYLRLFNYLIPRKDMVQLPVLPLETEWHGITSGHYLDEFAENHSKDMVVRESLTGVVPAAGVGCAFSRRAIETVVRHNGNMLFSIDSLTEDYDFGFRLREHGLKQVFVRHAVDRTETRRSFWTGRARTRTVKELIAIREYFPATFRAAYRQKARWIVGIALQGWAKLGWRGDTRTKYMLFRDRKGLVTNVVNMLGYVAALAALAFGAAQWLVPDSYRYPPIVEQGSWLWHLLLVNTLLLALRLCQRAYFVQRLYGWRQALLSMPRQVWGNVVNFAAAARALYLFGRYLATGKLIAWDKTAHVYPSEEQLSAFRHLIAA